MDWHWVMVVHVSLQLMSSRVNMKAMIAIRQHEREDSANVEDLVAEPRAVFGYILKRLADGDSASIIARWSAGIGSSPVFTWRGGTSIKRMMVMVVGCHTTV